MESKVLTHLQETVLTTMFAKGLGELGFYLTGGTALSEFYLQHRYSDDLDFFTRKSDQLETHFRSFRELFISLGLFVSHQMVSDTKAQFFVSSEEQKDSTLKIEFARDVPAMMAPPLIKEQVVVDSFEDIAVNKVCTILSRGPHEPKDFCDLFFILRESSYTLEYLIGRAREKEAAFDGEEGILTFATNLLAVRQTKMLPRMIKPLTHENLETFLVPLAEGLIRRLRPGGGTTV